VKQFPKTLLSKKQKNEASKDAKVQRKLSEIEADFNCSNNGCGKGGICLEDNHIWTRTLSPKFFNEGKEGKLVKWRARSTKEGKQFCECDKVTKKVGYKPGLKKEFAAVRRALLRLYKKNQELKRKRKTRKSRKQTRRRR